jgi:hypothetical protein
MTHPGLRKTVCTHWGIHHLIQLANLMSFGPGLRTSRGPNINCNYVALPRYDDIATGVVCCHGR